MLQLLGFKCSTADAAFFVYRKPGAVLYLLTYVDDILLASGNLPLIGSVKRQIMQQLDVRDMGEAKLFLGMEL